MKKYVDWVQNHWVILGVIGSSFWTFLIALWYAFAMPIVDGHIDARVMKMANDSLAVMIDAHMSEKGGGFRGAISKQTGIEKDNIADTVSALIFNEPEIKSRLVNLENELEYQHGYNFFILKQVAEKDTYKNVTYWLPPDGNVYFRDVYGYVWDAKYDSYDKVYYYYPSYGNGNRIKCE